MKASEAFITDDTLTISFMTKAGTLWVASFKEDESGDVNHTLNCLMGSDGELQEWGEDEEEPLRTKPPLKLIRKPPTDGESA
jgi:hypothetical protein